MRKHGLQCTDGTSLLRCGLSTALCSRCLLRTDDKTLRVMLAGGIAGCVSKTITAPLARLTILYQAREWRWRACVRAARVGATACALRRAAEAHATCCAARRRRGRTPPQRRGGHRRAAQPPSVVARPPPPAAALFC
jgi:hypothetical protein